MIKARDAFYLPEISEEAGATSGQANDTSRWFPSTTARKSLQLTQEGTSALNEFAELVGSVVSEVDEGNPAQSYLDIY